MNRLWLASSFAAVLTAALGSSRGQDTLTPATYDKLREAVDVKPKEMAWQKVRWRATFFDALVQAQKQDKPIFLWIYEGDVRNGC